MGSESVEMLISAFDGLGDMDGAIEIWRYHLKNEEIKGYAWHCILRRFYNGRTGADKLIKLCKEKLRQHPEGWRTIKALAEILEEFNTVIDDRIAAWKSVISRRSWKSSSRVLWDRRREAFNSPLGSTGEEASHLMAHSKSYAKYLRILWQRPSSG